MERSIDPEFISGRGEVATLQKEKDIKTTSRGKKNFFLKKESEITIKLPIGEKEIERLIQTRILA
ncbi:hypothetical protein [Leptospira vanthielii]|uniref:Uncharacterized protein n=1 Tax=Leptospira vanthielii serovar Holland str. Waz Holland = ATCC 700522 TaxID=1218591 RepID=N1WI66_9LEPT|nr:hypothetical protein [Leptospira vanthielii]EMY71541.1 hypothetical protein LEP1GSC199_1534 [Leptospira vanthielii serovar Holland str. Waz Holland = ATCC 700522]